MGYYTKSCVYIVSFPDPVLLYTRGACAAKGRGGKGWEGSGDKTYPSMNPGWNGAVGDKYALVITEPLGRHVTVFVS